MQAREWYEQNLKQAEERGVLRGHIEGKLEGKLESMARLCELRLGRPPSEAETAALASLLARVGEDRIMQAAVSFSPEALAAWLADPQAE